MALCQGARGQSNTMFFRLNASTTTVITAISPQGVVTWSNATTGITTGLVQRATTLLGQSNWVDYVAFSVTGAVTQLRVVDPNSPASMAYIPAGIFTMGDTIGDGYVFAKPTHKVNLNAFYMDKYEVTKARWDEIHKWATNNGYSFTVGYNAANGKVANHPIYVMLWHDVLRWCNARSQIEGLSPAYYTDAEMTTVYKKSDLITPIVNWNAGYRLPTEAEWEYAARGGLSGKRFPWGDTITHNQANYHSTTNEIYDQSATRGYHPIYATNGFPYTSPVGSFAPNGYGLYDMMGNVWEWCWDWPGIYESTEQTNPHGVSHSGYERILRGGTWMYGATNSQCSFRYSFTASNPNSYYGFRTVRSPAQ